MKKFLLLFVTLCMVICQPSVAHATTTADTISSSQWPTNPPTINAEAAIVMEASTGTILYSKNVHQTYYPASITKILTSLLAIENSSLGEVVTHSKKAIFDVDLNSSRIGIDVGEQLTMEQSLYSIMLESANEVSYAVAEHISGDVETFTTLMNEKAKELGALNTNFTNPHGLPDPDHYTTAYDMAVISRAAINNDTFRKITKTRTYVIPPTNIQKETRYLANHHKFILKSIPYEGALGGKTGYTSKAKYTLVTFAERNGMTLISVIMCCESSKLQYQDTKSLLNYGFDNFSLYKISDMTSDTTHASTDSNTIFSKYNALFSKTDARLQVDPNGYVVLPNNANISDVKKEVFYTPLVAFNGTGNIIGHINYTYFDTYIGNTDIIFNFNSNTPVLKGTYVPTPVITIPIEENLEIIEAAKSTNNFKAMIIGLSVGLIVLLGGLYVIFIEIPHQKRKRNYLEKRNRRKSSSIDY